MNLKFDEEPKYQAFMSLFDPLCGPQPHRPILTDGQSKVTSQAQPEPAAIKLPALHVVRLWTSKTFTQAAYGRRLKVAGYVAATTSMPAVSVFPSVHSLLTHA